MTNPTPTDTDDPTPPTDDEPPADLPGALTAAVVEYDDEPDECTLYPTEASEKALVTEWITAEEGSYVDLDEMR
jgi:hypothetical protein